MFVLFRLMPGDPVAFLIQPGLTPQERDAQRVAYGFARWESAPGVFKTGSFTVPDPGLYSVTIDRRDSKGNTATLHAPYVDPKVLAPRSPATGYIANAPFGFAANPVDISPFSYVTNEDPRGAIFTAPVAYTRSVADVYLIVRSSQGDLGDLVGQVLTPRSATNEFALNHPLVAVDRPVWEEFWYYLAGMLTGSFGNSFQTGRPVSSEIRERVGPTLLLFGTATIVSVLIGIGGGGPPCRVPRRPGASAPVVPSPFFFF